MKTNGKARKRLAAELRPGEQIEATVRLQARIVVDGGVSRNSYTLRYLREFLRDADVESQLRHDLGEPWLTLTNERALFHKWKVTSIRPSPGDFITETPIDDLSLHWADMSAQGVRYRMMSLLFADGRFLILYSPLGPVLRKNKNWDDEAAALIEAFGDRATGVDVPSS